MTCRALNTFARDPQVVCTWLLCYPAQRIRFDSLVVLRPPVLERIVRILYHRHMNCFNWTDVKS